MDYFPFVLLKWFSFLRGSNSSKLRYKDISKRLFPFYPISKGRLWNVKNMVAHSITRYILSISQKLTYKKATMLLSFLSFSLELKNFVLNSFLKPLLVYLRDIQSNPATRGCWRFWNPRSWARGKIVHCGLVTCSAKEDKRKP